MQPYFFPYIGYFQLIASVDKFVIYDDVNYINRGWINRNYILMNGVSTMVNIPLAGSSQNKLISNIEILDLPNWKLKFLRTLEHSYKKAPLFPQVFELLELIFKKECSHIGQFNFESIQVICDYLEIQTKIIRSSSQYQNKDLFGQYRIIDICEKEKVSNYINPIGGIDLYDKKHFHEKNIILNFIQPSAISYNQKCLTFTPFLSIIDVLMNCEIPFIKSELLTSYKII